MRCSDAVTGIHRGQPTRSACPIPSRAASRAPPRPSSNPPRIWALLLVIAMIVVYIILGILYESFIHPLTILSGLPSAAVGALSASLFIWSDCR